MGVHAMVKSQQAMVTKKNQEIAELQKELNLLREIIPKREGDGGEAPTLLQLEIPANSEEILNLRADVKALKRKYFYTLILGIKLSLMQQGLPVRLNANEMFERACHVPYESWDHGYMNKLTLKNGYF